MHRLLNHYTLVNIHHCELVIVEELLRVSSLPSQKGLAVKEDFPLHQVDKSNGVDSGIDLMPDLITAFRLYKSEEVGRNSQLQTKLVLYCIWFIYQCFTANLIQICA